jgi:uncharacterized phage-associated protein
MTSAASTTNHATADSDTATETRQIGVKWGQFSAQYLSPLNRNDDPATKVAADHESLDQCSDALLEKRQPHSKCIGAVTIQPDTPFDGAGLA